MEIKLTNVWRNSILFVNDTISLKLTQTDTEMDRENK